MISEEVVDIFLKLVKQAEKMTKLGFPKNAKATILAAHKFAQDAFLENKITSSMLETLVQVKLNALWNAKISR